MRKSFAFRVFPFIFGIAFLGIIAYWCVIGYTAYKVASNPQETAKELGRIVKSFNDGMNDTTQIK